MCNPGPGAINWGSPRRSEESLSEEEYAAAQRVAIGQICPNSQNPITPYEIGAVKNLEAAILRAMREAKL